jgi:hypothetical protein
MSAILKLLLGIKKPEGRYTCEKREFFDHFDNCGRMLAIFHGRCFK